VREPFSLYAMQHKYLIHRFLCYDSQHYKNDLEIKGLVHPKMKIKSL